MSEDIVPQPFPAIQVDAESRLAAPQAALKAMWLFGIITMAKT
jgi:hypothetical protein